MLTREQILEQQRKSQRIYALNNKEKIRATKKLYRENHLEKMNTRCRNRARRERQLALDFLGNKCVICGFDNWKALQIDHSGNNGNEKRKHGVGYIYRRVLKHPEDYQLLFANCNWIKRVDSQEDNRVYAS